MKKILLWFKSLFNSAAKKYLELMNKAKPFLAKEVPMVINVVNALKAAVENPMIKFVISSTKTQIDDEVAAKLSLLMPKILVELKLFQISVDSNNNQQIFDAVIAYLRSIDKENRAGKYTEIAAYLVKALADGQFKIGEIIQVVQMAYDNKLNLAVAA